MCGGLANKPTFPVSQRPLPFLKDNFTFKKALHHPAILSSTYQCAPQAPL